MPTPMRNVRVPDEIWFAAQEEAVRRGETVTDAVNRSLARYAKVPYTRQRTKRGLHVTGATIARRNAATG